MKRGSPWVGFAVTLCAILTIGWLWFSVHGQHAIPRRGPEKAARAQAEVSPPRRPEAAQAAPRRRAERGPEKREKEDEREAFDKPREFAEFELMKRLPAGAAVLPVELYLAAKAHNEAMPRYNSAVGMALPPRNSGQAVADNVNVTSWTYLGPGNIGGRVRALLIDPNTPATMYAGGVAGGVWKTTNSGGTWTSVGGVLPNLAVNSMAMDPQNSSIIYAGTGEGYFNIDAVRGYGIFKTTDGGNTWTGLSSTNGNANFYFVNKLVVSPLNSSRVYAATETGVFQSTDGGNSWTQVLSSGSNGCFDLAIRTDKTNDYIFTSCGTFSQAYIYLNQTADTTPSNWTQVYTGGGNMGLTALAIAPSNQNHIYALTSSLASGNFQYGLLAVVSSTNGGVSGSWSATYTNSGSAVLPNMLLTNAFEAICNSSYEDQGWYDNVIAVDPTNENRVWAGGIDLFRSDDGGATWGLASYWWTGDSHYSHADQHAIVFHPQYNGTSNTTMFVGSDGGISETTNATAAVNKSSNAACSSSGDLVTWSALNHNLGITQFYDGAVFPDGSAFFGGTQDNGTVKGTVSGGSNAWSTILGGDGGYVAVDPTNTSTLYGEYTGLSFQKSTNGGGSWSARTSGISDSGMQFITPFTMDPNNAQQLWIGGSYLWRTSNAATSWTQASTQLNGSVSAIAVAPGNSNIVAAGTSSGTVYYTSSAQTNTSSTTWPSSTPRGAYLSWLAYDPNNSSTLYATYSTFGSPHVYKSTNSGATWTSIDGGGASGLPDVPVLSIAVNPANSQMIFVGTDLGVYSSSTGGNSWNLETTGFADAAVYSLTLLNLSGTYHLYAFTHGYGVWSAPLAGSAACTYALSPDQNITAAGSSGTTTVTTQSGCMWTAMSNASSWLSVTSGGSGTGTGSFNWSATANSGAARSGSITVSGGGGSANFNVNEAAQTYLISGTVTASGNGLAGVMMTLSGSAGGNTTTGAGGGYSFTEAAAGNYTVTPSLAGYTFTPTSATFNNLSTNMTGNFTATLVPNVTVTTAPSGLTVIVDGVTMTAPASVYWTPGSQHTLNVASPQGSGGTQYVFSSWSDSGAQSHQVTAPASGTYTASFQTQYLLTTAISPSGAGTIGANPSSASGYYNSGASVQLTASAASGFVFSNWTGALGGSTNPQSVTMNAPVSVTANFTALAPITVTTVPSGLQVIVDGTTYTSPATFSWTPQTNHTLNVSSPQGSNGVIDTFASWSDAGNQLHTVTAPASAIVYTATFSTQYQLTTAVAPPAGGTIAASPTSANGYYNSGTSVQLTATAQSGYQFANWSGDLSGSGNPQSIAMNAVHSVTANFTPLTAVTVTTAPAGLAVVVDGNTLTAPQQFQWAPGSVHTLSVTSPQATGTGARGAFASWSDGGGQSHNITTPAASITYSATFTQQYLLTTAAAPSGVGTVAANPSSADGYYNAGTPVQLSASVNPGFSSYQFVSWSGDLSGGANPQSVSMTAPRSVTANFQAPSPITIASVPAGLTLLVDGNAVTTPQTFNWLQGTSHTLAASSPQGTNPRYVYSSWSDGGAPAHAVLVGASGATYTATYGAQYPLTVAANPAAGGSVAANPPSGDGYYASGTSVQLTATANSGYQFTGWSGDLGGSTNPQTLSMTASHTATANFAAITGVTVTTNPSGLAVVVDGTTLTAPQSFNWSPGSIHTLSLASPQGSGGTSYVFANWSDGGAQAHSVTAPGTTTTYTATFTTEYLLTTGASPAAGGSIAASPASANGFYVAATAVQLTATANAGYQFTGWGGDLTGTTNPQSIAMAASHNVTANFTALTPVTLTTAPAGLSVTVDGSPVTTPQVFQWLPGSSHAFSVASPQASGTGARAVFTSWSDGGGNSHTIQVPATATIYTATFGIQYLLTATATPAAGGTIVLSPPTADGYYNAGTTVQVTGQPATGYELIAWSGDLGGAANPQSVSMTAPRSVQATFAAPVNVTVATAPAGLSVTVDGAAVTAPQTFSWLPGSNHTVTASTPQGTNPRYALSGWSDGGAASHTITAPLAATTYTATFAAQYLLTAAASIAGAGSITATPASADGYYAAGTSVQLLATANAGYQFTGWSGDATGTANPQSLMMSAARSATANFIAVSAITIGSNPSGLQVTVDGNAITTPQTFQWQVGSSHAVNAVSPLGANGTRDVFLSWSDGGAQGHSIVVPSGAATYQANYSVQYLLAMAASPAGDGTVTASPSSSDGYYNGGASVQLTAAAKTGYQFTTWSGDLTGSANPQSVTMSAPRSVTASFGAGPNPITITTVPSGLSVVVDGVTVTAPQVFTWQPNSTHTLNVASPQSGTNLRDVFASWSDGGAQSHSVAAPSSAATFTATFVTQYPLTTSASPLIGGTVTASPASPDGYYNAGSNVQLTASANSGYQFSNWIGDLGGTANPQGIVMNAAHSATANFSAFVTNGLAFYPVTPCRVVDTRNGTGTFGGPMMVAGGSRDFPIPSGACNIPNTAQAYSLNVTAIPQSTLGYLTIWPAGQAQPYVSTLNSPNGAVTANAAIVPAGSGGGAVSVYATDATQVILDIDGYFAPPGSAPGGLAFYPLAPCRIVDTRTANGTFGGPVMASATSRSFPLPASGCHIPATAQAYSLNMTAVPVGGLQYLTTWPTGETQPMVSTLNAFDGRVAANAAIVPAGASGAISVYVSDASNVVIDINGYFAPGGNPGALYFYSATPCRVADTRNGTGTFGGPEMAGGSMRDFPVPNSACNIPSAAQAYAFNVTVVPPAPMQYLSIWPSGSAQPVVSTLNAYNGAVTANAAIVPAGTGGSISVYVSDLTQVVLDINGYFAP